MTFVGVQRGLEQPHRVERVAVLAAHVGAELDPDAVVVVHHAAGVERGRHPVLPDPVVQRERVGPSVGHDEAAVDHRAPRVPVREVHPQLEAGVGVGHAHRAVQRVVDRLDARVGRDDVERAPDRGQLGLVRRVVEVVAPVPPALARAPGSSSSPPASAAMLERPALLRLHGLAPRPRRRAPCRRRSGPRRPRARTRAAWRPRRTCARPTGGAPPAARAGSRGCRRRRSGNATAAKRRSAGIGTSWSVARVITPSVPSEPDEQLGQLGADRVPRHLDRLDQAGGRRRDAQR